MKDNKITIMEKDKVYIFQVETALKAEDMQRLRQQLKEQIEEGCVLLPGYVKLLPEPRGKRGKKLGFLWWH